tara:strand:+ start:285 stop:515 length:231 start_codon:yes stop_codon:yes gene_type:complete
MDELDYRSLRLEVLRTALEFGTQRDIVNPDLLFDKYWEVVMQGSGEIRPKDNRKDDSLMVAKKPRSVRKGSASQLV